VKQNLRRAKILDFFIGNTGIMLATTLVGTNICVVCAATMTKLAASEFGFNSPVEMVVVTVVLTLSLLAAEIIPKDWFRQYPYHRCMLFAYPLYFSYIILFLPVRIMALFTELTTSLFSRKRKKDSAVSLMKEDFRMLLHESENAGVIDEEAADILDRSLEFHELRADDIYIPENKVTDIPGDISVADAVAVCRESAKSRIPVRAGTTGDGLLWKGVFSVYDAIFTIPEKEWQTVPVRECLRPLCSVPENGSMEDILMTAKSSCIPIMSVRSLDDEQKEIGIVTSKDVLKVLFG
jgi:CBS domain containing-hemolysin-like protein